MNIIRMNGRVALAREAGTYVVLVGDARVATTVDYAAAVAAYQDAKFAPANLRATIANAKGL